MNQLHRSLLLMAFIVLFSGCSKKKEVDEQSSETTVSSGTAIPQVVSVQERGDVVPNFSWKDASGKTVDFDSYRGKVTLVNFWATWCGPCIHETPDLVELSKELADKNVKFIGISTDRGPNIDKDVKKFADDHKIPYLVVLSNEDLEAAFGNVRLLPTTFLVDEQGKIRETLLGVRTKAALNQSISSLLE
jgi:thiol-disulfide isomerase/thioredoxin